MQAFVFRSNVAWVLRCKVRSQLSAKCCGIGDAPAMGPSIEGEKHAVRRHVEHPVIPPDLWQGRSGTHVMVNTLLIQSPEGMHLLASRASSRNKE